MALNPFEQLQSVHLEPRQAFEEVVASILRATIPGSRRVRVHQGDGGVDVFNGTYGQAGAVEVYQIKYFPGIFTDSRKQQIRESYETAKNSPDYKLRKWILCVPVRLSKGDLRWFDDWREQEEVSIELLDGDDLTDLVEKNECEPVRRQLRSWGVAGMRPGGARLDCEMFSRPDNTGRGFAFILIVQMHNTGSHTARNVVVEIEHAETHCIGMAASDTLWKDESSNAAANPKKLRARQPINPGEQLLVLGIPTVTNTPFPFSVSVRVSAEDVPMTTLAGTITLEQATRSESIPLREGVMPRVESTKIASRPQPTSAGAKELLAGILANPDAEHRGITHILEGLGDPRETLFMFTIATHAAPGGDSSVRSARKRGFTEALDELIRLGWLHQPESGHNTDIYEFKPE